MAVLEPKLDRRLDHRLYGAPGHEHTRIRFEDAPGSVRKCHLRIATTELGAIEFLDAYLERSEGRQGGARQEVVRRRQPQDAGAVEQGLAPYVGER